MSVLSKLNPILSHPLLYVAYQSLVGGIAARKKCIQRHVRPTPGMVVLDIGCGPGYAISCFTNPEYYGFDISPEYIKWARRKFSPPGHFRCQFFDQSALQWLPKVDVVLLLGVLHHVDNHQAVQLLDLARQAMKPDGLLVTLDGCYLPKMSRLAKFFLDEDRGEFIREPEEYVNLGRQVFQRVESVVELDLFYIPYTNVTLRCRP